MRWLKMNKMLDDWYEDLGRQDRYRERFEINRRRGHVMRLTNFLMIGMTSTKLNQKLKG